jgi:hypothetical protein
MTFSLEARQIHNQIVENSRTSDYWIQAASAATKRGKFGGWFGDPQRKRDFSALTSKLKEQLGGQFPNASNSDWREVADWLFEAAPH